MSDQRLKNRTVLRRVLHHARPYSARVIGIAVLDLLSTPLFLLTPVPLKLAVDSVIGDDPAPRILRAILPEALTRSKTGLLATTAGLVLLIAFLNQMQALGAYVLRTSTGERLTLAFRSALFRHAQRLSLSFHDSRGTADSIYRIQYDAPAIQWITIDGIMPLVGAALTVVITGYVMFRIDWQLALVALIVSPFLFLLARRYDRRMRPRYRALRGLESRAFEVIQEVLTSFRVVKAFGREDRELQRFHGQSTQETQARTRLAFSEGVFGLALNLTIALGTALVLFIGVSNVRGGLLTLGELLMIISYLAQLYAPLQSVSEQTARLQDSLASAERAFELLDALPEPPERPGARKIRRARGVIDFCDVSFSYDGRNPVLHEVSFGIEEGARLGIAGQTGAGKTTILSLLARFYDPDDGQIFLDGRDLRDLKLSDVRNQFAIVLQEPILFSTSIAENIAYAKENARMNQIVAAAKAAGAHEFIVELPNGYDTQVGERGMQLSGGERQRIALARAFLKDAPVLLLDEPTSSVDQKTEAAIMEAMDRLMEGRTTLMIAHRPSTLRHCDMVVSISDGRIVRHRQVGRAGSNGHPKTIRSANTRKKAGARARG